MKTSLKEGTLKMRKGYKEALANTKAQITLKAWLEALYSVLTTPDYKVLRAVSYDSVSGKPSKLAWKVYKAAEPFIEFTKIDYKYASANIIKELSEVLGQEPIIYEVWPDNKDDNAYLVISRAQVVVGGDQFGPQYGYGFRISLANKLELSSSESRRKS
jgi:hypothetical protein